MSCRAASSEEDTLDPTTVVVAVVTTSSCPHCRRAKTAMTAAGIAFEEIDASSPDGIVLDAARQLSGMRTVPQVFVGGTCYGGADDVEVGIGNGDLARQVDDAGARARREGDEPVPVAIRDAIRDAKAAMDDAVATRTRSPSSMEMTRRSIPNITRNSSGCASGWPRKSRHETRGCSRGFRRGHRS